MEDGPKVPVRGEAAWKSIKEGVAERNEQAKKLAKQERKDHLANADKLRLVANAKRQAKVKREPQPGGGPPAADRGRRPRAEKMQLREAEPPRRAPEPHLPEASW